ncbi:MAG: penicillin-binding protein 2, partial [Candidatus Cloacimonetes bacterium]|nr:penicillin-binding protein 2 [Candidatus Cloacimonadota bacterium]
MQTSDPFDLVADRRIRYEEHKEFIMANRGNIYDANGEILATTNHYYQIDIDVSVLKNKAEKKKKTEIEYFHRVSNIIGANSNVTASEAYKKLLSTKKITTVIGRDFNQSQLNKIREQMKQEGFEGALIYVYHHAKRVYPKGTLAARLLGLTTSKSDQTVRQSKYFNLLEGRNGIELSNNKDLLGEYGWNKILRDRNGQKIPIPNLDNKPVIHGASVYLTIDSRIQEILENNLQLGIAKYSSKNAIGVILNPKNGDIIAMAGINENDKKISDTQLRGLSNLPTQHIFEPGSTIKPLVSLLAIEKNLVKETDMFDCRKMIFPNKRTISDSHDLGTISFREVIVQSSNVGVSKIADIIGKEALYQHYVNYGFGKPTKVDLLEERGILHKLSDWTDYSMHSVAFGQEMSVTALQLANIYCAFANGGELLKPNIVKQKVDANGKTYSFRSKVVEKKLSNKKSLDLNNSFLYDVVEEGTGVNTRFDNIKIGGKTG